ncbi:hypothetical protein [Streptomyces sp. NBC_00443]|uniref:hypothetical protein n=1 Tax=Streptomyces sp. NBC_00443 TaxID=2975743 RepID=UPI002E24E863
MPAVFTTSLIRHRERSGARHFPQVRAHASHAYARDHWYGVSTTAEFKKAAQSVTGKDLNPFWKLHRIR